MENQYCITTGNFYDVPAHDAPTAIQKIIEIPDATQHHEATPEDCHTIIIAGSTPPPCPPFQNRHIAITPPYPPPA